MRPEAADREILQAVNLLATPRRRLVLFSLLYLSEGGPIGFIWWALPTLLRSRGVPVERITGLLALLVLPWTLKFLWAPLIDTLRTPRWGFRAWIICAQGLMGITLIPLAWLDPVESFGLFSGLLLMHGFSAATQDVAIDALAISVVPMEERGLLNGCMQGGMLSGRSLFGGGVLVAAGWLGWGWVYAGLVGCVWFSLALLAFARETPRESRDRVEDGFSSDGRPIDGRAIDGTALDGRSFLSTLRRAFARRSTWVGLLFALVSAAGFEAAGALAGPFLLDRGVSKETIGLFLGIPVVAAMLTGGLAGGRISDRLGRKGALAIGMTGFSSAILGLAGIDWLSVTTVPPTGALLGLLALMYFFVGAFVASSYALFMDLTDPGLGATQFSAFMAATNGCESWATWAGGRLVAAQGYAVCFAAMSAVSLAALPLVGLFGPGRGIGPFPAGSGSGPDPLAGRDEESGVKPGTEEC